MLKISSKDLSNESDVEQKFIMPLLTQKQPQGLEYALHDIRTKTEIKSEKIGKGSESKQYFPDYVVILNGLPVLIIEAKNPKINLDGGIKEARLYATEINKNYPTAINPLHKIIITNGITTKFTDWDSDTNLKEFSLDETTPINSNFSLFIDCFNKKALTKYSDAMKSKIRGKSIFIKPVLGLGSKSIRDRIVPDNSFGSNISIEYKYLFNPESEEERRCIVNNAYIASKRKLSHVRPIDRIIRSTIAPSHNDSIQIENTSKPIEILNVLEEQSKIQNQVILLIGNVGAGKSTFVSYLKEVGLSKKLTNCLFWLLLNMNNSPSAKNLVFDWLLDHAIEKIQNDNPKVDICEFSVIEEIFQQEINDFKKGSIKLLEGSEQYNLKLFEKIDELCTDKIKKIKALIKYFYTKRNRSLIFVLDNVDKRNRDTQLLMFEVANWLRTEFHCTVFLPLREITYDHYRDTPPLDTVIKDFVFRIDSPILKNVIQKRLEYATKKLDSDNTKFVYFLNQSIKVDCQRNEVINYLSCILNSLFENTFFRRLITGLSERNIRKGLEFFLDVCKSGYISEDDIIKMRLNTQEYALPNHIITRILLRSKRRYYSDANSNIKNIFHSYPEDDLPDPFVRLSILNWIKNRFRKIGPNKNKGYHRIEDLKKDLISFGHSENRIDSELIILIESGAIITESQSSEICPETSICITSAGHIYFDLIYNLAYLSAIAEDTFFKNSSKAKQITDNIIGNNVKDHLSKYNSLENSKILVDYLVEYQKELPNTLQITNNNDDVFNILSIKEFVDKSLENNEAYAQKILLSQKYPIDTEIPEAMVIRVKNYGIFVEIGIDIIGLVHYSNIPRQYDINDFEEGDIVSVEILKFNRKHGKFDLKLVEKL